MKKIIASLILLILFVIGGILLCHNKQTNTLKVAEVTHSVFYAPQYLADSLGFFEEEGLNVEFILTPGADKVTAAVLSGDVQIGLCGSEATIYVYNKGEKDYLVNFSALTKRDGSFLISRKKEKDFNIKNLEGKHIIGGRKSGMPVMTLEWALKENGVDIKKTNIDTSIEFAAIQGAFIGGTGDYVSLFEPNASQVEKQGYGYIVASLGELGGAVPYTAYNARKSYIENNTETIDGFTKAIQKALTYIKNHNDMEIAEAIASYFPESNKEDLSNIIAKYRAIDAWYDTTEIAKEDFKHLEDIMISYKAIDGYAPYDKLVLKK